MRHAGLEQRTVAAAAGDDVTATAAAGAVEADAGGGLTDALGADITREEENSATTDRKAHSERRAALCEQRAGSCATVSICVLLAQG